MKVLFYPDAPIQHQGHTLSKTIKYFKALGYELTNDINSKWDVAVHWNHKDINKTSEKLLKDQRLVFNRHLNDVTKLAVERHFKAAFGYSSLADTRKRGYCICKSNRQSAHDGEFVKTPCSQKEGWIYQKLIDNRSSIGSIYDIRIPIFRGQIPFLFIKTKTIEGSFEVELSTERKYYTAMTDEYLSIDEVGKVKWFCRESGFDLGEIDAVRDNSTGKLYLIDINNIPGGGVFDHIKNGDALFKQLVEFFKRVLV